jgi:NAD(P)-dependent dehydrogenase (short-subunit alcohol dehydrogenase family)
MKILVIDGQGGKMGKAIVEQLVKAGHRDDVIAVGTNAVATAAMIKSGVAGATGENPVKVNAAKADYIIGPMGIIAANSLLGEITPAMALAVSESNARKLLIPVSKCNIQVMGTVDKSMNDYIMEICEYLDEEEYTC